MLTSTIFAPNFSNVSLADKIIFFTSGSIPSPKNSLGKPMIFPLISLCKNSLYFSTGWWELVESFESFPAIASKIYASQRQIWPSDQQCLEMKHMQLRRIGTRDHM